MKGGNTITQLSGPISTLAKCLRKKGTGNVWGGKGVERQLGGIFFFGIHVLPQRPCNHICTHTYYTTGSRSPCAPAAATLSACALFSPLCSLLVLAVLGSLAHCYLSSPRPTVQLSRAHEAQLHTSKNTPHGKDIRTVCLCRKYMYWRSNKTFLPLASCTERSRKTLRTSSAAQAWCFTL